MQLLLERFSFDLDQLGARKEEKVASRHGFYLTLHGVRQQFKDQSGSRAVSHSEGSLSDLESGSTSARLTYLAPVKIQGPGSRVSVTAGLDIQKPFLTGCLHLGTAGNEHSSSLRKGIQTEVENPLQWKLSLRVTMKYLDVKVIYLGNVLYKSIFC